MSAPRVARLALGFAPVLLVLVYVLALRGWLPTASAQPAIAPSSRVLNDDAIATVEDPAPEPVEGAPAPTTTARERAPHGDVPAAESEAPGMGPGLPSQISGRARASEDILEARARTALVLAVAKVAANEASLARIRPAEVGLIWQVTEGRADTARGRLRWLRAHSSCVLTDRERTDREMAGNCGWSRGLADSDRRPEGWPRHLSWARYAPRWAQVRELARRLVQGELVIRPCPSTPWSWGGRAIDMAHALERGLVPLDCRDPRTGQPTINEGFALAPRRGDA